MTTSGVKTARHCSRLAQGVRDSSPPHPARSCGAPLGRLTLVARDAIIRMQRTDRGVCCRRRNTNQTAQPESVRVVSGGRGRVLSQSLLVARERRRRELGSNLVIVTTTFTSGEGHVVEDWSFTTRAEDLRRCSGIRCPSGTTSWRYHSSRSQSASIGLLVTDQFVKTIYVASTEIRWRRKSKIVHAKRPG